MEEYEWRRYKSAAKLSDIPKLEVWDGDLRDEGELILTREQGFGDTIFMLRFAQILSRKVSKLSILVKDHLKIFIENQKIFHKVYSYEEKDKISLKGRSCNLEILAELKKLPALKFVSLQKGVAARQIAYFSFRENFVSFQKEINLIMDVEESAAIIANCDLFVTHLSSAI